MLFKLSYKNIKKSFRDYVVYFFTLIIGVSVFYVFNAIDSQTVMMDVTASTKEIIKMMTNMLSGLSDIVVMIFNTFTISKCKLIDLLQYSRRTEEVKMKNPWICMTVFLMAVAALSYAYRMVSGGTARFNDVNEIFIPIVLGAVSTFFIFWSLSGLLLKMVMACKNVYYKGLNSFTLRQFSSQINTMVMSVTVICLMLFITICVLSSALSIKNSMNANLDELAPADIQLQKRINMDETWLEKGYKVFFLCWSD